MIASIFTFLRRTPQLSVTLQLEANALGTAKAALNTRAVLVPAPNSSRSSKGIAGESRGIDNCCPAVPLSRCALCAVRCALCAVRCVEKQRPNEFREHSKSSINCVRLAIVGAGSEYSSSAVHSLDGN
jgi:hypothetical protein